MSTGNHYEMGDTTTYARFVTELAAEYRKVVQMEASCMVGPDAVEAVRERLLDHDIDPGLALLGKL